MSCANRAEAKSAASRVNSAGSTKLSLFFRTPFGSSNWESTSVGFMHHPVRVLEDSLGHLGEGYLAVDKLLHDGNCLL
jgi:hypothetical protein